MEAADSTYMLSFHQILALIFDSKKGFVVKQEYSLETGFMSIPVTANMLPHFWLSRS